MRDVGGTFDSDLGSGPTRLHCGPGVGGALGGVDQEDSRGTLTLGLFDLIGPAPIVGEDGPSKDRAVAQARVIHQDDHDLVFDVQTLVIVPVVFRGYDTVPNEDQVARRFDGRIVAHRPEHVVVPVGQVARGGAEDLQGGIGGQGDDGDMVVVAAAVSGRLQSQPLELGCDVLGRQLAAPGARPAPFQRIVRQELQMGSKHLRIHGSGDPGCLVRGLGEQFPSWKNRGEAHGSRESEAQAHDQSLGKSDKRRGAELGQHAIFTSRATGNAHLPAMKDEEVGEKTPVLLRK